MRFFDTHCHLDFEVFDSDLDTLMSECRLLGVDRFVIPATKVSAINKLLAIQARYQGVYVAFGIHPFFVDEGSKASLIELEARLSESHHEETLVALGEIGLDKFCAVDYALQKDLFEAQLKLAASYQLPVILHNRKSDQIILELLDKYSIRSGVLHAFTGSIEIAREFIKRGFKLGLGGVITWANATKVRAMVEQLPLDAIVLETDSPDMSPEWLKGCRNTPKSIPAIVDYLARIKQMSVEELSDKAYKNSCEVFAVESA